MLFCNGKLLKIPFVMEANIVSYWLVKRKCHSDILVTAKLLIFSILGKKNYIWILHGVINIWFEFVSEARRLIFSTLYA